MPSRPSKLLAIAALMACAGVAQAEQEALRLYNWADYFAEDTLKRFTAETGIPVIYDVMDGSEVLEAKLMSGRSGYDLVFPGDTVAERLMRAGSLQALDRKQLTALDDIEPGLRQLHDRYPKASQATVPYTWGTIGLTMDAKKIRERMPDAPLDSLDLLFKPEYASRLKDCGIAMPDSPQEVIGLTLNYLGKDPYSQDKADLNAAQALLQQLQPSISYVANGRQINDLANGSVCLALTYNGDAAMAADQARRAGKPFELVYRIPREGTLVWQDNLVIPKDAPHPEAARAFITFMLRPDSVAALTNTLFFANANQAATPLVDAAIRNDPDIYPPAEVRQRLFADRSMALSDLRQRNRLWTTFRSRQ